jgi:acetyl-CoA C-acetyltransferase
VYLRGWCYATDPVYVAEHPSLSSSPAMRLASSSALGAAGIGIDDVAHIDLYSCFASSVLLACDALGISFDRGVTVTGGLPFSGGAGSNYMMHSIAAMASMLREDPGSFGLVSGVGMHMTKHVYGVYSTTPGAGLVAPGLLAPAPEVVPICDVYAGPATIASYTVAHARSGEPEWGLVIADIAGGQRVYGSVTDPSLLAALEADECVGSTVDLVDGGKGVNLVKALAPAAALA